MAIDEFCWNLFEVSGALDAYLNYTSVKNRQGFSNNRDDINGFG
jgi:hypothetical protein